MNKDILELLHQFMQRVELRGNEVPVYNKVMQELTKAIQTNAQDPPNGCQDEPK